MPASFAQPFMYWVGIDLDSDDPEEIEAFNAFYTGTHVPEVVAANPGFTSGHRYELLEPDARPGVSAPRFLAVYEMTDEAAAKTYITRNDGPPEGRPRYTPGPPIWGRMALKWRMIWRSVVETGPAGGTPESIFLVGMDPPADADATGLAEFNDFYTKIHLPEVVDHGGYRRGTRHERHHEFLHPSPGCPRYLALYEAGGVVTGRTDGRLGGAPLTPGPPVWDGRNTQWRLVYQRLPD